MPPSRKRSLRLLAGTLFAVNVLAILFVFRSATSGIGSDAQYAATLESIEVVPLDNATTSMDTLLQ